jgi:chromosome segregation ATPase
MSNLAYTKGVAANELLTQSSALSTATPWAEWSSSSDSIQSTRNAVSSVADNLDQIIAQLTDRLGTLKTMEGSYRELGTDLKNFAAEMLDHYLTWDEAKSMASQIQSKLSQTTSGMVPDQARDLLLLLG